MKLVWLKLWDWSGRNSCITAKHLACLDKGFSAQTHGLIGLAPVSGFFATWIRPDMFFKNKLCIFFSSMSCFRGEGSNAHHNNRPFQNETSPRPHQSIIYIFVPAVIDAYFLLKTKSTYFFVRKCSSAMAWQANVDLKRPFLVGLEVGLIECEIEVELKTCLSTNFIDNHFFMLTF